MAGVRELTNSSDYFFSKITLKQPLFFMMSQLVESLSLSH